MSKAKANPKPKTYKAYAVFYEDRLWSIRKRKKTLLGLGHDKDTIEPVTVTRIKKEVRK